MSFRASKMAKEGSANPNANNTGLITGSLNIPQKPPSGMEKLEDLYKNIPEGFEEELTLANIAGTRSFKFKESTTKPKRKEEDNTSKPKRKDEINLDAVSEKLEEDMKVKSMTRQSSNNTDSSVYSIDFGKALQAVKPSSSQRQNIQNPVPNGCLKSPSERSNSSSTYMLKGSGRKDPLAHSDADDNISIYSDGSSNLAGSHRKSSTFSTDLDHSYASAYSVRGFQPEIVNGKPAGADQNKSPQKRQGTPHSNICGICDKSVFMGKYRCLVCGRLYCKACVAQGMGDMPEGRKCIPCVGHRFSQRYISRAGKLGCCMSMPSTVKQAELKWAELGPRKPRNRSRGTPTHSPRCSVRGSARVSPTRPTRRAT